MEDNSINSSKHKSVASKGTTTRRRTSKESDEDSGWTAYFEDLSNNHQQKSYCNSSFSFSSSLISDAATTAAASRKISHDGHHVLAGSSACAGPSEIPKKLTFKKTRTKEICEDDSLEDTASSPVNSPKGKKSGSGNYSESQINEEEKTTNFDDDHGMKTDCTELKKRGLCLVPLSMLVNYLR